MKAKLILIAIAAVLLGTLTLAPPAQAGHLGWSFGVGFHVGGLHFRVGFSPAGYGGYPGPFFLTTNRLHYPGYSCNGACFRRGADYYHHSSCPLLGFHFGRGGFGPDYYVNSYSPYRGYGPSYGRYPGWSYGEYYRNGYRDRYRSYGDHYYRGKRHYQGKRHYRGKPQRGYRDGRGYHSDRERGRGYQHDSKRDRGRRDDVRGRNGGHERAQPRPGANRTRPPD